MKFFILIDTKNNRCNILCMENVIDQGINALNRNDLTLEDKLCIKECLLNNKLIEPRFQMEYLVGDDEDVAIPMSSTPYLMFINGEMYKFFGDYSEYVMRLFAEDLGAQDKYDIIDLIDESDDFPYVEKDVELKDGTNVTIRLYQINRCIF